MVRTEQRHKPPGLTSYNVEVGIDGSGALANVPNVIETTAGIDLHAIDIPIEWTRTVGEALPNGLPGIPRMDQLAPASDLSVLHDDTLPSLIDIADIEENCDEDVNPLSSPIVTHCQCAAINVPPAATSSHLADLASRAARVVQILEHSIPSLPNPHGWAQERFVSIPFADDTLILDNHQLSSTLIPNEILMNPRVDLPAYYVRSRLRAARKAPFSPDDLDGELATWFAPINPPVHEVEMEHKLALYAAAITSEDGPLAALQRNAAAPRDFQRLIPEPIVIVVQINGQPARALLDSGSLSDFVSAKFAHQLNIKAFELAKPLPVHLAVQGSRAKINCGCRAVLEYQRIRTDRYFDIVNLLNYDLILGTPILYQHRISLTFNPMAIVIGSDRALPVEGKQVRVLESRSADDASDSPLPPLRAVNHRIPLKDETRIYSWRLSKCPDAHRASWVEKRDTYLKSGRWKMTSARNTSPMLLLTKPGTGVKGIPPRLRVVCDLRERNANTHKVTSPLPDMDGILRRIARKPFRSLIDGKDAYEHIRIEPGHVDRTAMTTPDGNMVSLVLQQGDCNAVATYQTLMNYLFGPFIGVFMDVYLDDIAIYSDTLEDHKRHVKKVIDILMREKLYLSASKLHFLCEEMKVLGRIVDSQGIRMDPDKVDSVLNWKVPTNKELLRGFLGSVGYLADDISNVRIPICILTSLTGSESSFKWDFTHQRAFDEIKRLVHAHRQHHRVPLDYSPLAPRIWLVTDGSHGGIAGVVTQGDDFHRGRVAAFFSAKLSSAQSNYPVHEIEMFAGVESMLRHRDILLGSQSLRPPGSMVGENL
ncbi:hypothetical protein NUW54_g11009 [Trametes sanguinea]|uniref:Uncharacterized protein n=1 Tax=Trametes sanguinea TaxID=158606 RepID=A0ACC1NNI3_9APHY|nr:hypothetical protein NUW54_g11009 [Trametes sanguinea]